MKFFASRRIGDITTRFSDAFTIKEIFTSIALSLFMDIGMALISGVILWQMNTKLFVIIIFMTLYRESSVANGWNQRKIMEITRRNKNGYVL